MRFTDSLKVVNEKMGQHLVVREALSQVEMIFGIENSAENGLSHIYMDVQEVTALVHAFHAHFRKDFILNRGVRDSEFNYIGYSDRTNIQIGRYRTTIREIDLQHLSLLLEKWLKHHNAYHGFEEEGAPVNEAQIQAAKSALSDAIKRKEEVVNVLRGTTNNVVMQSVMKELTQLNDEINRQQQKIIK